MAGEKCGRNEPVPVLKTHANTQGYGKVLETQRARLGEPQSRSPRGRARTGSGRASGSHLDTPLVLAGNLTLTQHHQGLAQAQLLPPCFVQEAVELIADGSQLQSRQHLGQAIGGGTHQKLPPTSASYSPAPSTTTPGRHVVATGGIAPAAFEPSPTDGPRSDPRSAWAAVSGAWQPLRVAVHPAVYPNSSKDLGTSLKSGIFGAWTAES